MQGVDLKEIEQLAAQKENEWRSVCNLQIKTLQNELANKLEAYAELHEKFTKLKEDFKYNLKLLQERDDELNDLDEKRQQMKLLESRYLGDISDLKIKLDSLKQHLLAEKQGRVELEVYYKQRLIDQQTHFEAFRAAKINEVENSANELQRTRSICEQKVLQLEAELEAQKIELTHEFEEMAKAHEKDFHEREQQIKNKCLASEMKNKILSKELKLCQETLQKHANSVGEANNREELLKNQLQKAEWDVSDISSLKNARILELEAQVQHLQEAAKKNEEEFEQRRNQLDRDIRCKQANLLAAKQANLDREKNYEDQIRKLKGQLETSGMETKRALWDKNELRKQCDVEVEAKRSEVEDLKCRLETIITEQSRLRVAKDNEIMTLQKRFSIFKTENEKLKHDIEKYKKDLSKAAERQRSLEREKAQLRLDWRTKCEEAESTAFAKSEDLTENLVKTRDSAEAEVKKLERDLEDTEATLRATSSDLESALEVLQSHHLMAEYETVRRNGGHSLSTSYRQQDFRLQNEQLKSVIKEMRVEMQQLLDQRKNDSLSTEASEERNGGASLKAASGAPYIESLEKEVLELKRQRRSLQEKLEALGANKMQPSMKGDAPTTQPVRPEPSAQHPTVQDHITSLNKSIANLEAEKIDLRAQLQRTNANLEHQRSLSHHHEHEAKTLSTRIQQLEYESTAVKHRTDQEIRQLKDRIAEITLQLSESRREADEYYKGGLRNNMRAMELSGKISQLTMDLAADTPWISSHVQAKVVQDLQDEVTQLRKKLSLAKQHLAMVSDGKPMNVAVVKMMQEQLKSASQQIASLEKERDQLLESGNRMRAEMKKLRGSDNESQSQEAAVTAHAQASKKKAPGESPKPSRLEKLEDLQYELTKQELAFARQRQLPQLRATSSDVSTEDETKPKEYPPPLSSTPPPLSSTSTHKPSAKPSTMYSTSSIDDTSMKDVWKLLEVPSSSSVASERQESHLPTRGPRAKVPQDGAKSTNKKPKKSAASKPKVRNYNVKDDTAFRRESTSRLRR